LLRNDNLKNNCFETEIRILTLSYNLHTNPTLGSHIKRRKLEFTPKQTNRERISKNLKMLSANSSERISKNR